MTGALCLFQLIKYCIIALNNVILIYKQICITLGGFFVAQSMTIRIDEELHKQAKIKATIEGISLKEYILNLIKEDLAKAAKDTNK